MEEELEKLSYYTTCTGCDEIDEDKETILEGVGEYHRESNTMFLEPCPECGKEMAVSGWLDECEDCGELHYSGEVCPD